MSPIGEETPLCCWQRQAESPLPTQEAVGSPGTPSTAPAKPGPAGSQPRGPRAQRAAACPAAGLCVLLTTQRAGKHSPATYGLHTPALQPCSPGLWGWAGELAIKPQPVLRRKSQTPLGAVQGPRHCGKCLLGEREPLVSAGDSPWPGAVLSEAPGKCLCGEKASAHQRYRTGQIKKSRFCIPTIYRK